MKILAIGEKVKSKTGNVIITNERSTTDSCEHCGVMPPFTPLISDGGCWWCLNCAITNSIELDEEDDDYNPDINLTSKDIDQINGEALHREKAYIKKRYEELFT